MAKKMKSFWFHYNKPRSQVEGKPIISLHFDDTCHFVENVEISKLSTKGRIKKRQPKFVVAGKCHNVNIRDRIAYIS